MINGLTKEVGRLLLAALVLAGSSGAAAQPHAAAKTIRALRITTPIAVDGRLDEAEWQRAEAASDFVQQDPHVNEPVSERTEIRVLVDQSAMYFGIVCHDSDPHGVIARELRRDNALVYDDRFEIVLDTFHDHRNAFNFVINPLGTQYDALITDEGHDVNAEWDERWWSETRITSDGWTAEIRIPLTTLRAGEGLDTFGVNFKRYIRRKNETAQWTGWDRDFLFLQVSQAGHLTGVEGLKTGLRLRLKPYVLGGFRDNDATAARRVSEVGIETVKVSLTPGLTAELTANTDFAQTEVDDAVVNLTRFPVFFPEKREFFLERAGIFEFGLGGRRGGAAERNLQMFFSRRIGLTDDRLEVPIRGGGKLIGHAGGLDLGLLNVQTGEFEDAPGSNYLVFRAKRNVLSRSNVGLFASNRQASSANYNRVVGTDANFTLFKNTDVQAFIARSSTPGRNGDDYAGRAKYNWFTDRQEVFLEHLYVGPEFQHDVGFVRRSNVRRSDVAYIWQPRPGVLNIHNFVFRGEVVYVTDVHRQLLNRDQITQWTTRFMSDDAARVNTTKTLDRVERDFEISTGVVVRSGEYVFRDTFVEAEGSGKRITGARLRYGGGEYYGGHRHYVHFAPVFRPSAFASMEVSYEFNDVKLPVGAFKTHVVNGRVNVNASNKWLTTTLAQYDSASRRNTVFFRLNYIFRPGDDLFVVFNQTTQPRATGREQRDRTLLVKSTFSFDF